MLFERQRVLLTLLDALGGQVSPTDFQKLLFLYTRKQEAPSYEFVPYKFGCFSFSSYADKRRLIEKGLLENDADQWKLTSTGRATIRKRSVDPLVAARFNKDHAGLRGNELVAEVYRNYPYYANCLRGAGGDESVALAKVRQKYMDEFLKTDLHFFLGTMKEFHGFAPNPWVIIGVLPLPHMPPQQQLSLFD